MPGHVIVAGHGHVYLRPALSLLEVHGRERHGCPAGRRAGGLEGREMSVRTGIVCAWSVAGRIAAVLAAVALLASAVGFSAQPAAAGMVSGFSNPERTVLQADVTVLPDDPQDAGTVVMSVPVTLQAGQTRRISDQLTVTVTRDAEVENFVECLDPAR